MNKLYSAWAKGCLSVCLSQRRDQGRMVSWDFENDMERERSGQNKPQRRVRFITRH